MTFGVLPVEKRAKQTEARVRHVTEHRAMTCLWPGSRALGSRTSLLRNENLPVGAMPEKSWASVSGRAGRRDPCRTLRWRRVARSAALMGRDRGHVGSKAAGYCLLLRGQKVQNWATARPRAFAELPCGFLPAECYGPCWRAGSSGHGSGEKDRV